VNIARQEYIQYLECFQFSDGPGLGQDGRVSRRCLFGVFPQEVAETVYQGVESLDISEIGAYCRPGY
jgi:hypothetical protein